MKNFIGHCIWISLGAVWVVVKSHRRHTGIGSGLKIKLILCLRQKKSLESDSKSVLRAGREHFSSSEESLLLTYTINWQSVLNTFDFPAD